MYGWKSLAHARPEALGSGSRLLKLWPEKITPLFPCSITLREDCLLRLDRYSSQASWLTARKQMQDSPRRQSRVLVVDDDEAIRLLTAAELDGSEFEVLTAADGEEMY